MSFKHRRDSYATHYDPFQKNKCLKPFLNNEMATPNGSKNKFFVQLQLNSPTLGSISSSITIYSVNFEEWISIPVSLLPPNFQLLPVMLSSGLFKNCLLKNIFIIFPDDIRCYCNLAKCVATGYMCKTARSQNGGCFSEVHNSNDKTVARHGCMELLQDE